MRDIAIDEKFICQECVGEVYLAAEIEREGNLIKCSYCDTEDIEGHSLPFFADRIDAAFELHYDRVSEGLPDDWSLDQIKHMADEYEPDGQPVIEAIMESAILTTEIARDVRKILSNKHYSHSSAEIGETCDYHSGSFYDEKSPNDADWQKKWVDFEYSLKTKTRFFSKQSSAYLSSVFYDVDSLKSLDKNPVVKIIGSGTDFVSIYRARVFQSEKKLKSAMESPDTEIGPPPSTHATAGRMNAQGISVFCGATNRKTALAEIRPPVGSKVLSARFDIVRQLKMLDLSALAYTTVEGSIFDSSYSELLSRTMFLAKLSERMTKPVMPDDEHFEYLPTQAIADFLGSELGFDGIIFPSAQSGDGHNIALLNNASSVKKIEHPQGSNVEAQLTDWEYDTLICSYKVHIATPRIKNPIVDSKTDPWELSSMQWKPEDPDHRLVSLSIDANSLTVEHINSIAINSTTFLVKQSTHNLPNFSMEPNLEDN